MALSFNGLTKVITITTDTNLDVKNLWSRWVDWFLTSDNSKFLPAMSQVGGNDIDAIDGTFIPVYIYLENGWKVRPKEANHTLRVTNGILLTSDSSTPYIPTVGNYNVVIRDQQPVQAITVATGGGAGVDLSLVATKANQEIINQGIKSASLLIPHSSNLPD